MKPMGILSLNKYRWKMITMLMLLCGLSVVWAIPAQATSATHPDLVQSDLLTTITQAKTNLHSWTIKDKGTMKDTTAGIVLTSDPKENVKALSATVSTDFVYEADVTIQNPQTDASLIFRSNAEGSAGYWLKVMPTSGQIQLLNSSGTSGTLQQSYPVDLQAGQTYHVKVKAEGDQLSVYWDKQYRPVMQVTDTAYRSGHLGLHVWDGSATFQNVIVSDLNTNLTTSLLTTGVWTPHIKGKIVTATQEALQLYNLRSTDLIAEADISFANNVQGTTAGLIFHANDKGTTGYVVQLRHQGNTIGVELKKRNGTLIAKSTQQYIHQPNSNHHLEIRMIQNRIQVFVDGYTPAAIQATDSSYTKGYTGMIAQGGQVIFQDLFVTSPADEYTEKYRPQYHYSASRNWISDPNGLVYFEEEYHLFYQDGGQWGHSVSTDLVHWKRLPFALKWNDLGHIWSGAAIADTTNASGLFGSSGGKGLVAYYTSYDPDAPNGNQKIGLAYSTDRGRTWQYSKEHPIVIQNPGYTSTEAGGWDFRDPKVVRDEVNQRWVMVVSGGDHIRFFTSKNLIDWTWTDNFGYGDYIHGGVWECPDLFPLRDHQGNIKWVLMISTGANPKTAGSDAEYFIGDLTAEGTFTNNNPVGNVLKIDWGKEFYAATSFANVPDGRRITLAWMTNWDYPFAFPTTAWKGEMTIPRELSLQQTSEGLRLFQKPLTELSSLRTPIRTLSNQVISEQSANPLAGLQEGSYEIEAEIELPVSQPAQAWGFEVRTGNQHQTDIGYIHADQSLFIDRSLSGNTSFAELFSKRHAATVQPINNRIHLRIFVDASSVEVFANQGQVVFSDLILPDPQDTGMRLYSKNGEIKIINLNVYRLQSIWKP